MNNLDKLFEKKLSDHSLAPSARAWDNLEEKLSKKNEPLLWVRWAAVFLLGGLILSVLWIKNHEVQPSLAEESIQPPAVIEELKQDPIYVEQTKKAAVKPKKKSTPTAIPSLATNETVVHSEVVEPIVTEEIQTQAVEKTKPEEAVTSIVLVYTLDPVGQPEKEHAAEEFTLDDKKDNSLKKVMKLASEVKNSESPLGGFRDMKEELFALDLRKKSTNKKH